MKFKVLVNEPTPLCSWYVMLLLIFNVYVIGLIPPFMFLVVTSIISPAAVHEMSSISEEQRSINPAKLHEDESNGVVESENIQDPVQFLLHSAENHSNRSSPSIYMIPSRIRDLNPKVFNPRQVSIGPLHKKNENLKAFEGKKATFLHDLLRHLRSPKRYILETCVQKVNDSLTKIKEFYGDGIKSYNDDEITTMMVMDGCFILEFFYRSIKGTFRKNLVIEPKSIAFDLVLIENQIPFFVLQDIFKCTFSRFKPKVSSLNELIILGLVPALSFFESNFKNKNYDDPNKTDHDHILGFIHKFHRPLCDSDEVAEINQSSDSESYQSAVDMDLASDSDEEVENSESYYSVVELDRAAVNFKAHHQPPKWPMDIEIELSCFSWCWPWAKPTLRMPVLRITSCTELVFRNLIAYEQLSPRSVCHYVTSYAIAMDVLIDNHEDVARLAKSEVLINTIGSNEDTAKLINDMCKEISCPRFLYSEVWKEMNTYHKWVWLRNIEKLRRTYFSNPWSIIALFAGISIFFFTMVQTYYTVNPM